MLNIFSKKKSKEKTLNITFSDYGKKKNSKGKDCTSSETIRHFQELSRVDGAFLTIGLQPMQFVQFMWQEDGRCLAEITNDSPGRIFMQRYVTEDDCINIIEAAFDGNIDKLEGFVPVPIMEKTLDEILAEESKSE